MGIVLLPVGRAKYQTDNTFRIEHDTSPFRIEHDTSPLRLENNMAADQFDFAFPAIDAPAGADAFEAEPVELSPDIGATRGDVLDDGSAYALGDIPELNSPLIEDAFLF